MTAGIDLALALVEEDLGRRAALDVARWLVLFVRRPGGQAQFSAGLAGQAAERRRCASYRTGSPSNLDGDLSVAALAERAFMSPRNFARVFAPRGRRDPRRVRRVAAPRARAVAARDDRRCSSRSSRGAADSARSRRCAACSTRRLRVSPERLPRALPTRPRQRDPDQERMHHERRHPDLRPPHRARCGRSLRGALAAARARPCASSPPSRGPKRTETGMLALIADRALDELPDPEVIVVPGRLRHAGADARRADARRGCARAHETSQWTTSVCTGSLLLAAAGHPRRARGDDALARARDARRATAPRPVQRRVVEQGKVITAAGVSAGIDMALTLAARIAGDELAQAIQLGIEYDPAAAVRQRLAGTRRRPEIVELVRRAPRLTSSPDQANGRPAPGRDRTACRARSTSAPPASLEAGGKYVVDIVPADHARSPASSSERMLKSPPSTTGAPPAQPSIVGAASALALRRGGVVRTVACRFPTQFRSASRTAWSRRRSGSRPSTQRALLGDRRPRAPGSRSHPPPFDLITSGQRVGDRAAQWQQRVARGQHAPLLGARSAAQAARGHHGGTSCSSATSHSQPASAAANSSSRSRPAGGTARPWSRFQVSTRSDTRAPPYTSRA